MEEREVITIIYDLLANNTDYQPREKWQELEAEELEDYWVDTTDSNYYIGLRDKSGGEYHLTLQKVHQD